MDGSKRSAHANAYFTGFGGAKRVVFFDTLLAAPEPGEVEAVLAHELGHFGTAMSPSASSDVRRSWPVSRCWAGCRPGWFYLAWACVPNLLARTTRWRCCCS